MRSTGPPGWSCRPPSAVGVMAGGVHLVRSQPGEAGFRAARCGDPGASGSVHPPKVPEEDRNDRVLEGMRSKTRDEPVFKGPSGRSLEFFLSEEAVGSQSFTRLRANPWEQGVGSAHAHRRRRSRGRESGIGGPKGVFPGERPCCDDLLYVVKVELRRYKL